MGGLLVILFITNREKFSREEEIVKEFEGRGEERDWVEGWKRDVRLDCGYEDLELFWVFKIF